ncbi:MAG: bifunctional (p)ppGpp synthetase/guanosine-3',5'-bis(diphosphate) 3'-pyrophosphohydrolase [Gammaproteobacteria bacterium]|nr:bifunctional (p)ppGpp synthetase/guanosine-3',5'-bis(diphosphate) 3'-pyrophosphohydrolase [Gammaproteobacteria bacterium]MBK7729565.1 bifunctional (p)ppGpp synthetase/guanosine-3',5'-bis(diphosphate) 3'-pyrophosphohydrolase [Gammaproteobacteria bacterium]MBK8308658.1 bifunctional (p)ppGpp synthetase/guanosine-3',5'-bis(diphosphate) 3'-pyrophosphohydrolase [Gammaproteobacteria bacterium]MBK9667081.1 bifunctional (p)ppGpp synthetase/guanosine-3',5'-bis(diphosphate) 3'-pyrophosphohydrolase [Gamm
MVSIRKAHSLEAAPVRDACALLERIPGVADLPGKERLATALERVRAAHADAPDAAGARALATALDIVEILAALGLDAAALLAGMLVVPLLQGRIALEEIALAWGTEVAAILSGVQRMDALHAVTANASGAGFANRQHHGESLRRMLVSMIDDPRVALVKLAERVQGLRALGATGDGATALRVAREAMDIYAPLAHRLGVGQLKWELEDLAFRHLHPADYRGIAALLDEKRRDREHFIAAAAERLQRALSAAGLQAEISGRPKHLYSIWGKMQRKGIELSEVYDVRALRVLVGSVADCYATLGVTHGLWRNLPGEFDDYIANPKANGYRSLHTAVIGDGGKVLEVQIRTPTMHQEAEFGICAHWQYKSPETGAQPGDGYDEKIGWLRQVLGWGEELDAGELLSEHLRREVRAERVYVLTPEGHVVDLPRGATPVDFAYHVHTGLGHHCRGAKVDGRIVSLAHALQTGERVEIIRGKSPAPNRDWLRQGNDFVHTARARSKIRHWFRHENREQLIAAGRVVLERELRRMSLAPPPVAKLAADLGFPVVDDMHAALGAGDIGNAQLLSALAPASDLPAPATVARAARRKPSAGMVAVAGIGNVLTHFARCCKPLPGDPIAGYVTAGHGVSVHRRECAKLLSLAGANPARMIEVNWQREQPRSHAVDLVVRAHDRPGLLKDIVTLLGNERVNVLDLGTVVDRVRYIATVRLTVEVASLEALGRILEKLARLSGVFAARRHTE